MALRRRVKPAVFVFMAVVVMLAVFAACGSRSSRDEEAARAVAHLVEKVDGIVRNDDAVWPPDLPEDVPQFTGGTILRTDKGLTANGTSWTVRLADLEEDACDAYISALQGSGWETTAVRSGSSGRYTARWESFDLTLDVNGKRGTLIVRMASF